MIKRGSARIGLVMLLIALGCTTAPSEPSDPPLFERLDASHTGVAFSNELAEDTDINILNYLYYYNGGGVSVGDLSGNGYPDLYFTSNLESNRLYINQGDFQFEDVTSQAGVEGPGGWNTGTTMVDVDGDGLLDIYVSTVNHLHLEGRNALYINNGDGTFTERAGEYGIDHQGYSTQGLFFDYDGDGDLDLYLLNHAIHTNYSFGGVSTSRNERHPRSGDRLFRNDGEAFVDVSEGAGIYGGAAGYGLGVVSSDLNGNGCPDIFVANDFHENDFLYYNNCDGTFTEQIEESMGHTSYYSMGVDAADFANSGQPGLMILDMLPRQESILKTSITSIPHDTYQMQRRAGLHHQLARNTLHLNRGDGLFSDIGHMAGVYATDWSWSALFADLNNNGLKDLYVTNGIYRRPNDLDYINYVSNQAIQESLEEGISEENLELLQRMPQVEIPNAAYANNGDLTFTDHAADWGLDDATFSNGAAYVDLNNNGALDLVTNNINEPAGIYRNRAVEQTDNKYLQVALQGEGGNTSGIGATVHIVTDSTSRMVEQQPTRGWQSSVDHRLHIGLGTASKIDSLIVSWPDRRAQIITDVETNQLITLLQSDADTTYGHGRGGGLEPLFEMDEENAPPFLHEENAFTDFQREAFMPHKLSTLGPAMAVGDVTGDGLDDVYFGGGKHQQGELFLQQRDGSFTNSGSLVFRSDSLAEDVDAAFFDATGNGALDLYVVSGGNEFWGDHEALRDRLYLNDGSGQFTRAGNAIPDFFANGSTVAPGDFNGDGHEDLFVGSGSVSRQYGVTPTSYLLENNGDGTFRLITEDVTSGLAEVGMVRDATWIEDEGDGVASLVVVGEWMPVRIFTWNGSSFEEETDALGFSDTHGWWNTVHATDLTGNGRTDLVLGNLGLNSYVKASADEPARLYINDFSGDGRANSVLTFYKNGISYPMLSRDQLTGELPAMRQKFPSYHDFADSQIDDIFSSDVLREAQQKQAYIFANAVAINNGSGEFEIRELPRMAQLSPIFGIASNDFTGDGHEDLLVGGNFYGVPPMRGRYDASYGTLLQGDGNGSFTAVDREVSGLAIRGEVRGIRLLRRAGGYQSLIVARNDATPILLHLENESKPIAQETP